MHFLATAFSFSLVSLASAAPLPVARANLIVPPPGVKLPTPDMFGQMLPGLNASEMIANISLFANRATVITEVDKSCSNNASDILGALALALYTADTARNVQAQDMAFNAFFLPDELSSVQSMFNAIAESGNTITKKQFKINCPTEEEYKFPNNTVAVTDRLHNVIHHPRIRLSPALLSSNSTNSTASTGASVPNGMIGVAFALLQEMTHLPTFGKAANLTSQACGDSAFSSRGTCDILSLDDEKNTGKKYGDRSSSPIDQAICLRSRWAAYNEKGGSGLQQPPIPPSKNAGSYSTFAALHLGEKLTASIPQAKEMMGFALMMMMGLGQQC